VGKKGREEKGPPISQRQKGLLLRIKRKRAFKGKTEEKRKRGTKKGVKMGEEGPLQKTL